MLIIEIVSRGLAKCFLFLALSIGTPAINAMRSIEEREAIVIVIDLTRRRRDRGLTRAFGYKPEYRFEAYV
jgi:hypothetical protein